MTNLVIVESDNHGIPEFLLPDNATILVVSTDVYYIDDDLILEQDLYNEIDAIYVGSQNYALIRSASLYAGRENGRSEEAWFDYHVPHVYVLVDGKWK